MIPFFGDVQRRRDLHLYWDTRQEGLHRKVLSLQQWLCNTRWEQNKNMHDGGRPAFLCIWRHDVKVRQWGPSSSEATVRPGSADQVSIKILSLRCFYVSQMFSETCFSDSPVESPPDYQDTVNARGLIEFLIIETYLRLLHLVYRISSKHLDQVHRLFSGVFSERGHVLGAFVFIVWRCMYGESLSSLPTGASIVSSSLCCYVKGRLCHCTTSICRSLIPIIRHTGSRPYWTMSTKNPWKLRTVRLKGANLLDVRY